MKDWFGWRNDSDDDGDDDDDDDDNNVSRTALGFSGRLSYLVWFLLAHCSIIVYPQRTEIKRTSCLIYSFL